jgi:hypothetical protein
MTCGAGNGEAAANSGAVKKTAGLRPALHFGCLKMKKAAIAASGRVSTKLSSSTLTFWRFLSMAVGLRN